MLTHQTLSITLPVDLAEMVRDKVRAGEYATERDVICAGLTALFERPSRFDAWLQGPVASAHDAALEAPDRLRTAGQVRARFAKLHGVTRAKD